jgi:hypothetical protein
MAFAIAGARVVGNVHGLLGHIVSLGLARARPRPTSWPPKPLIFKFCRTKRYGESASRFAAAANFWSAGQSPCEKYI